VLFRSQQLLGNHGYGHLDLAITAEKAYIADIEKNELLLEQLMGQGDYRYYRYPFLSEGETKAKRDSVRAFLQENHYKIAEVTVDFFEYQWNDPYVRCLNRHKEEELRWLTDNYLQQAENALVIASLLSNQLYHREIKHVLLLHMNAFTAEMLDDLLTHYEQQGVTFISLGEALSDKAYQFNPDIARVRAYTFLNQVRLAYHLDNPKRVEELYDSFPEDKLNKLCQKIQSS
jgi:peptidoglycan/xylan/chitin deacetylase (PgdA/CDA1 family)